jgi:ankyrin repeat protein
MAKIDGLILGLGAAWLGGFWFMASDGPHSAPPAAPVALASAAAPSAAPVEGGGAALMEAAQTGDLETARRLIDQGVDVNAADADQGVPLHWAVYYEDRAMTELLLANGADPTTANREGSTPLMLAAMNGDAETLRMLLDAGAAVDGRMPNGETALMFAAGTGVTEPIELLLDRGADIEAKESLRGTTPLMWAAAAGNTDAVRLLISRGADVSATSARAALGRGPYLAPSAQSRITAYRIGYGEESANVSEVERLRARASFLDQDASERLRELQREEVVDPDAPPPLDTGAAQRGGGLTALVFAARNGDMATAQALIEAGANVNQTTAYGWTPLLTAVQNRYYRLAAYFLEQGADPNIQTGGGWSPLYIAVDNRNIEGGDYPTRRPDMDHFEMIRTLLDKGADPNLRMKSSTETRTVFTNQWLREEGATPFLRAAQSSDLEVIRLLLDHGADPNIATDAGVTPLMVASGIGWVEGITYEWSRERNREVVQLLLDLGADVNAADTTDGRTALMGAAHKGRPEIIELLVTHGADLAARDVGSRDSVHKLYGARWSALDYADGLVRVGVQSASPQPEASALLRRLMTERGIEVPPEGRTLDSICIVDVCQPEPT